MDMDMDTLGKGLRHANEAISLIKSLRLLLPKSSETEKVDEKIKEAERALKIAEAQVAESLGYYLCKCTFPPQIMLFKGKHPRHNDDIYKCEKCGNQEPSEEYFRSADRLVGQTRYTDF